MSVFTTKFGELCEAVLQKVGYLRHKKTQENPMEEVADVSNIFKPENHEHLIGQEWVEDRTGVIYRLVGIVYGSDDWDWLMYPVEGLSKTTQYQWLSCVGSIENFGFTPKEEI
ncbi:hypothetical protein LCGC14_0999630 [marine sediment metagenome]|uniref:Uncharacterized protein n=1 Tax=marine sediment metagenome TaxID=412755 RepID=A0A0F9N860_9ZZZZ